MPNREMVINGLREMSYRATWKDIDRIRNKFQPIINSAIDFLKEQEPVKPERDKETGRIWLCGKCGSYVGFEDHDEDDPNEFDKFCRECGHPVLWEGR